MRRALAIAALLASSMSAQCVMCYRTSHSQNMARARVLNMGILLLGAPPFLNVERPCKRDVAVEMPFMELIED